MATWNSRGLRGSALEEYINRTCEQYREKGLALIQKVPTPITPVRIDQESRHITLAYFEKKSTVDYIGAVQGIPVCFDAKECACDSFPLQNIHAHQVAFMKDFERQQGIAFLILYFSHRDEIYYMPFRQMEQFWERGQKGGIKHFKYSELSPCWFLKRSGNILVPFLEGIQMDLDERAEKGK
nr:Holliday junction resolvase RecU [uncultured Blautia sp.]